MKYNMKPSYVVIVFLKKSLYVKNNYGNKNRSS